MRTRMKRMLAELIQQKIAASKIEEEAFEKQLKQ